MRDPMNDWVQLTSRSKESVLGLIPDIIRRDDPRSAKEQVEERYAHGGGWRPIGGFKRKAQYDLHYPGDGLYKCLAYLILPATDQRLHTVVGMYMAGIVAMFRTDDSFDVVRMD